MKNQEVENQLLATSDIVGKKLCYDQRDHLCVQIEGNKVIPVRLEVGEKTNHLARILQSLSWDDAPLDYVSVVKTGRIFIVLLAFLTTLCEAAQPRHLPAFPGAQGFGSTTPGGRGGKVIRVTNLNDSGPGSLRAAVEAKGSRIVVFRVGGTIALKKAIAIRNPFITIAGQTAPGDGICLKDSTLQVSNTHDVVIRGLRLRPGDNPDSLPSGENRDGIGLSGDQVYNVIVDHCSISWSIDENVQLWGGNTHDVTFQWCIISEALASPLHPKGAHSMGILIGNNTKRFTLHHNLLAHNQYRNPLFKANTSAEIINNVVYNWGWEAVAFSNDPSKGYPDGSALGNIMGNFFKPGTNTLTAAIRLNKPEKTPLGTEIFFDNNSGTDRLDDTGSNEVTVQSGSTAKYFSATPVLALSGILTENPKKNYKNVLATAGAIWPQRDEVDSRIVTDVKEGNGRIIASQKDVGGWPDYRPGLAPDDIDKDGMPDHWEIEYGLNPQDDSDHSGDLDGDGYSNIEEFINFTDPTQI